MTTVSLSGIIDMHIHSAPDVKPRTHHDLQLAEQAAKHGARAIVIKSHFVPTMDRAWLVSQMHPQVQVFGSITLSPSIGGINPHAVEAALRLGAKIVWLPTLFSTRHRSMEGKSGGVETVADGKPVPALKDVLRLVAEYGAVLGTGHLSPAEIFVVVEEARTQGVGHIVVTHPEHPVVGMTLPDQRRLVEQYGVLLERTYWRPGGKGGFQTNFEVNLNAMKELGCKSTLVSTDGGMIGLPPWSQMITEYIQYLADHGVSSEDIHLMTRRTPARLLGLE